MAARLFGRHIRHRTHHDAGARAKVRKIPRRPIRRTFREFRQTEIQHLHEPVGAPHQVLRLDVAVDDACAVRSLKRLSRLHHNVQHFAQREFSALEQRTQRWPFDVFGRNKIYAVSLPYFINREDVRMIERRGCAGFLLKAAHTVSVACEAGGQDFERDQTTEPRITREIDFAHAARTELALNFIAAEFLSGGQFSCLVEKMRGGFGDGRLGEKVAGVFVRGEQGFDLSTQSCIARAGFGQIHRAL